MSFETMTFSSKPRFNKKILAMIIVAGGGLMVQIIITSIYPASEFSFTTGFVLAIFCVILAIQIRLFSKARKEIPRE